MSFTITTRVVLHKDDARKQPHPTDAKEYDTLHAEMHSRGYRRFYENSKDVKLKLPPGEYTIEIVADDGAAARSKAMKKAKESGTIATSEARFSVLVTGGDNVRGYQLETVTKDPDA